MRSSINNLCFQGGTGVRHELRRGRLHLDRHSPAQSPGLVLMAVRGDRDVADPLGLGEIGREKISRRVKDQK